MIRPLPPGRRDSETFPRFGLTQFARRFPEETSRFDLEVSGSVKHELRLSDALNGLPRTEQVSDFHCVTTWSRRSLRWGGVRFLDFYEKVIVPKACPRPQATIAALRDQDGARGSWLASAPLIPTADFRYSHAVFAGNGRARKHAQQYLIDYCLIARSSRLPLAAGHRGNVAQDFQPDSPTVLASALPEEMPQRPSCASSVFRLRARLPIR